VKKGKKTFAKLLEELEKIASDLEEGELDLETAIKKYEAGIKAYRECRKFLDSARKRIEILSKDSSGNFSTKDFSPDDPDATDATSDSEKRTDDNKEKTLF
jgi:exodeoxyribonuclease VII small subunit